MPQFKVNGKDVQVEGLDPDTPLLWVLRDFLQMTGTRFGCGVAQCGCCTVHVDGTLARACVTPLSSLEGREIITLEGLSGRAADALRNQWRKHQVPQCGYCQSGQLMTAAHLLQSNSRPSVPQVEQQMERNICRCGTYSRIHQAVLDAAKELVEAVKSGGPR